MFLPQAMLCCLLVVYKQQRAVTFFGVCCEVQPAFTDTPTAAFLLCLTGGGKVRQLHLLHRCCLQLKLRSPMLNHCEDDCSSVKYGSLIVGECTVFGLCTVLSAHW
jgi:hypothetical protein